jgi:hypothetical protein
MINCIKLTLALLTLVVFSNQSLLAQDTNTDAHDVTINIPEVALLDIEPAASTAITLAPAAPTEAGDPIDFSGATDNSLWINYSSIVGSTTEPTRKVTVAITSGTVPGGMLLKVQAGADAGNGDGTVGSAAGQLTLSGSAQDLVTGIGSCYTNTPENNGHQLTYVLELDGTGGSYANLDFDDATTLTITYTLTDN